MANVTHGQIITGGGMSIQTPSVTRSNSGPIALEDTLAAAKTGTLTTRSDANTGTLTMSASHGIVDGDIIDIYWAGGVQYGVTVGTVSVNSVPIDLGIGDDLPIATTAITAVVQSSINLAIDGDNADFIAIVLETTTSTLNTAGHIQFLDASEGEVAAISLVSNVPQVVDIAGGATNIFTGNPITHLKVSQGNSTTSETYTIKIIGIQDASP